MIRRPIRPMSSGITTLTTWARIGKSDGACQPYSHYFLRRVAYKSAPFVGGMAERVDKRKRGLDLPLDVQPLFAALLPWLGKETRKANDGKFYTFDEFVHDLAGAAYMSAFQSKVKDLISVSS